MCDARQSGHEWPVSRKLSKLSGVIGAAPNNAPNLVPRIWGHLEAAAEAGIVDEVETVRLRAELHRLAALRRVLRRQPQAPLARRA